MSKLLVAIASRGRPRLLQRAVDTIRATAHGEVRVAVYIDNDEEKLYGRLRGAVVHFGERVGPVASLNKLVDCNPGYEAYGAATDDCEFLTPGWDQWVSETAKSFRGGVGVMGPYVPESPGSLDFPWVTAQWYRALGYFGYRHFFHNYWDVALQILGDQVRSIRRAMGDQFLIQHLEQATGLSDKEVLMDAKCLAVWAVRERAGDAGKLEMALHG